MPVIFCNDPLHESRVDEPYQREFDAARKAGLRRGLLNYEALTNE